MDKWQHNVHIDTVILKSKITTSETVQIHNWLHSFRRFISRTRLTCEKHNLTRIEMVDALDSNGGKSGIVKQKMLLTTSRKT